MGFLRKLALVFIVPILTVLLFALASSTSVLRVFTDSAKLKAVISQSDIYESVVPGLLQEAGQVADGGQEVKLGQQIVKDAAVTTITPQFVQANTEKVLDSIYYWLDGNTPLPDFEIDLTETKKEFAANVATAVEAKLSDLPACPEGTPTPSEFDPFQAKCLPSGVDPSAEATAIEETIANGSGFLDHPVITANTLKSKGETESIFSGPLKHAPQAYQAAQTAPIGFGVLALIFALALIFLSSTKANGLRRLGILLLIVGVIIMLGAYGVSRGLDEGLKQFGLANQVLEDSVKTLVLKLSEEVNKTYWIFGVAYGALGISAIAGSMILNRGGKKDDREDLEGEGETPEDRIELDEPDKPTEFTSPRDEIETKPKPVHRTEHKEEPKHESKPEHKPEPKKAPRKIKIQ